MIRTIMRPVDWTGARAAWAARLEAVPNDRHAREQLALFDAYFAERDAEEHKMIADFLDELLATADADEMAKQLSAVDRAGAALDLAWRAAA